MLPFCTEILRSINFMTEKNNSETKMLAIPTIPALSYIWHHPPINVYGIILFKV